MEKKYKILLGVGLAGLAAYLIYNNKLLGCPKGKVPCQNNTKCYDPSITPVVDPCR